MRKELIISLKSNTGKDRRKKAVKVFKPTKRKRRRKKFVIAPLRASSKAITHALENFWLIKITLLLFTIPPQPLNKSLINHYHSHYQQLFYLTKPFDYPLILIKIFIGIGQELKVLPKSLVLILTLSQQFSLHYPIWP